MEGFSLLDKLSSLLRLLTPPVRGHKIVQSLVSLPSIFQGTALQSRRRTQECDSSQMLFRINHWDVGKDPQFETSVNAPEEGRGIQGGTWKVYRNTRTVVIGYYPTCTSWSPWSTFGIDDDRPRSWES